MIADYKKTIEEILPELNAQNVDIAVKIAQLPDQIRGYGPVKEKAMAEAKTMRAELLQQFANPHENAAKLVGAA